MESDGSTQAAAKVIVPGGSDVTALRYTPPGGPEQVTSTSGVPAVDRRSGFPLLAYRQLCDVARSDVGLDQPRLRVALSGSVGAPDEIAFGDANFNGAGIYAATSPSGCIYLVTTSSVSTIAALAGQEAAVAFRPPPAPDGEEATEEQEVDHPWVAQANRYLARSDDGSPPF